MRTLHLACMPFPSPQGTQAIVAAMMRALPDATLLTYSGGTGESDVDPLRLSDFPRVRSLRSGPSLGKLALDVRMIAELRRRVRDLSPDWVIAHNVEAACVAWAARVPRWAYFAHTRFDTELPTYFSPGRFSPKPPPHWAKPSGSPPPSPNASRSRASAGPRASGAVSMKQLLLPGLALAGRALDAIATRADAVLAITPALAEHLGGVHVMPPWPAGHVPTDEERREARVEGPVVLYAGNLDAYQGLDVLFEATRGMTLLVATESEGELPAGVVRWPLRDERDRRRAHAAADLVVVPRRSPGGLPIKLLDALARDVPVVAQQRALAGLNPDGVLSVPDDDATALRHGIASALANPPRGGRAWLARNTNFASRFFDALLGGGK